VSKIRDAMRKSEGEYRDTGAPRDHLRPGGPPRSDGPLGLVPAMSPEVLVYYESIGKQIEVALGETRTRTLVFTGSIKGEGISTVIAQYAEMLSRRGERVLLVDANPRHPTLHHIFNAPDAPGLAEYVAGAAPREAIVHATGFANLDLVPLGRCLDRSHAERVTESVGSFIRTVDTEHDSVLVDIDYIGSPFFPSPAVSAGDGIVLVIRAGKTNREVAARACGTIRHLGGRMLGVILNRRQFPIPNFLYRRL